MKTFCNDASHGVIEVYDLLRTSPTLRHAMKTYNLVKAFVYVIGKALYPLKKGQERTTILITSP
jgi:hypothetical protein